MGLNMWSFKSGEFVFKYGFYETLEYMDLN